MRKDQPFKVRLDETGRVLLPPEVSAQFGLIPGGEVQMELTAHGLNFQPSVHLLAKVYIEPTNLCNLDCATCMRSVWDEPLGCMTLATFDRIMDGIRAFSPKPAVFFGGYGEPLAHPDIAAMVQSARSAGLEVELITNGTLLDEAAARWMVSAGLNRLWVSIDGALPASYADIRLGAELPKVLANISQLQNIREQASSAFPKLGIAFVAMKQNIADLPEVIRMGKELGADFFSVSGVLPHTPELRDQILYKHSLEDSRLQPSDWAPVLSLTRSDLDEAALRAIAGSLPQQVTLQIARKSVGMGIHECPFVEKGSVSIRWDGVVSPCLALLHTHTSYLGETERKSHAYRIGSIQQSSLMELWQDPAYVRLRERLQEFDFSPCAFCNSCQMAESNLVDCFGNDQPVCGGCLWAQGFIQCP
ncbi:MAG TPA: radical SAM protein [Bellilinea sp.]|nr:radical SAM protein [Bellilinea sp.]